MEFHLKSISLLLFLLFSHNISDNLSEMIIAVCHVISLIYYLSSVFMHDFSLFILFVIVLSWARKHIY